MRKLGHEVHVGRIEMHRILMGTKDGLRKLGLPTRTWEEIGGWHALICLRTEVSGMFL